MKKVLKWIGIIALIPVLLFAIMAILLYLPPIQTWVARGVAAIASDKTGMEISVGHVSLAFPLDLDIQNFKMIEPNDSMPQVKDTVTDAHQLVASIQLLPLFHHQVEVDELCLHDVKINTTHFIPDVRISGHVGSLNLVSHNINLTREKLHVNKVSLEKSSLTVHLSDTVPPDTTPNNSFWKLYIDQLHVKKSDFALHLPGDTLQAKVHFGDCKAAKGFLDLKKNIYRVGHLALAGSHLQYDNNYKVHVRKGLDKNHLDLLNLNLGIDDFYYSTSLLRLKIRRSSFHEKSGLVISQFSGPVLLNSVRVILPQMILKTPSSAVEGNISFDFNAFNDFHPGMFHAMVHGYIGRSDLMYFVANAMPETLRQLYPDEPLTFEGVIDGNLQTLRLYKVHLNLPSVAEIRTTGWLSSLTRFSQLRLHLDLDASLRRLHVFQGMFSRSVMRAISFPNNIHIAGAFDMKGKKIAARFTGSQGGGSVRGQGCVDLSRMSYKAILFATHFPLRNFLVHQNVCPFTGTLALQGKGTDVLSPKTHLILHADIRKFSYGTYNLDGVRGDAHIRNGQIHADIDSRNPLLQGLISFDALVSTKYIRGTFSADISNIDLHKFHVADEPLSAGLCAHVDIDADLKNSYKVQGMVSDMSIRHQGRQFHPEDMVLDILTRRDSTHAVVDCGDFHLHANARGGYRRLLHVGNRLMAEVNRQMKARTIDQVYLRRKLPYAQVFLSSGVDNIFMKILNHYGYRCKQADINLDSSPLDGLNGTVAIDSLVIDSVRLDTVRLALRSDSANIYYNGQIRNNISNPQYVFNSLFQGQLMSNSMTLLSRLYDQDNRKIVDVGVDAALEHEGIRFHILNDSSTLGYRQFSVNKDNFVYLSSSKRLSAKINLLSNDNMGVQVFTNDSTEALQDLSIGVHKFDLEKVIAVIPYLPNVSGIADGDFHVIQTKQDISVSSSVRVADMTYENCPMGNVGAEFVYMPKSDDSHYVDGILLSNDKEVGKVKGTYSGKGKNYLDADFTLERLPMDLINGFFPEQLVGLKGFGEGTLSVEGPLRTPDINGEIYMDSCYLFSDPYGVQMRFANDPVRIVNSKFLFENFEMFANNANSLDISGSLDISKIDRMMLDVKMQAHNLELIDAKENARSEVFGKVFVNYAGIMRGPLDNLFMRGKLDVLGNTDMTYVLGESQVATENQLDGLVKFINFADSTQDVVKKPKLQGLDMGMSVSVDESAHILCSFKEDRTNNIDLMGGGDLMMSYTPVKGLQLTGRYTLGNGQMRYSLPVIPLRTFNIQEGSYLDFTGEPMNPTLNIKATENVKTTVSSSSSSERSVDFVCGVKLTKTLEKPGIQFVVEAPNDMTVQDELNTLTDEGRSKVAITMLASGMYLADGNTSSFSMNSALSAFLNSQINNITGSAMQSMGLNLGMTVDNTTTSAGSIHTDYNFQFSKRLWNNRLNVVIGGKISSGADLNESTNTENTFFDNVELQYRLGKVSSKYITLFYNNNTYDWLEGQIGEYGVGVLWRKKVDHLKDLFKFSTKVAPAPSAKEKAQPVVKGK